MEKVYMTTVRDAEASRILLTFCERAYVWSNHADKSAMAETVSDRKMAVVRPVTDTCFIYVDERMFSSTIFWNEAFTGLEKSRFWSEPLDWLSDVFNVLEAEVEGYTPPPLSFCNHEYKEADYASLCRTVGVKPANLVAEAEEIRQLLKPLDLGEYEEDCVIFTVCRRVDRDDEWFDLTQATAEALYERRKWDLREGFIDKMKDTMSPALSSSSSPSAPTVEPGGWQDDIVLTPEEEAERASKPRRRPHKPAAKKTAVAKAE